MSATLSHRTRWSSLASQLVIQVGGVVFWDVSAAVSCLTVALAMALARRPREVGRVDAELADGPVDATHTH